MNPTKMVIVVRKDVPISHGKVAGQVAHAAVSCSVLSLKTNPDIFNTWFNCCQKKIVTKVKDLDELTVVAKAATAAGLTVVVIRDAGLTQIPAGTITCIGIGPDLDDRIDPITNGLQLY